MLRMSGFGLLKTAVPLLLCVGTSSVALAGNRDFDVRSIERLADRLHLSTLEVVDSDSGRTREAALGRIVKALQLTHRRLRNAAADVIPDGVRDTELKRVGERINGVSAHFDQFAAAPENSEVGRKALVTGLRFAFSSLEQLNRLAARSGSKNQYSKSADAMKVFIASHIAADTRRGDHLLSKVAGFNPEAKDPLAMRLGKVGSKTAQRSIRMALPIAGKVVPARFHLNGALLQHRRAFSQSGTAEWRGKQASLPRRGVSWVADQHAMAGRR